MTVKTRFQHAVKSKLLTALTSISLVVITMNPASAAIEIDETDFGPSYDTMVVDTVVGKPLQLVAAVTGTAAYLVSLPFAVVGGNADQSQQKLFVEPWEAMSRCLGCTVRIVVDQPSEILINTNDYVVVTP